MKHCVDKVINKLLEIKIEAELEIGNKAKTDVVF